ncbi:hypothetical protein [Polaromonas sp.]|uniref:hypothetical protein n=1 Tax=Polaromonas sp. TaxID=1869339 RepID=UPI003561F699
MPALPNPAAPTGAISALQRCLHELRPNHAQGPYALHTPEATCVAWGHNLAGLKTMGRIAATEREEFASWGKDYQP